MCDWNRLGLNDGRQKSEYRDNLGVIKVKQQMSGNSTDKA
ncbi:24283_t:CDS:2 [Cetraspora pellucida]|uniref:24283_t:CDS:1 n=1 Tax=Cetraspora pellucida TaxID=1433469 RepID=A0A9N9A9I8_9GLOM|nr:24283_t:CDS:2 [Cetraspora pellucida]